MDNNKSTKLFYLEFEQENGFSPDAIWSALLRDKIEQKLGVEVFDDGRMLEFTGENCKFARKLWKQLAVRVLEEFGPEATPEDVVEEFDSMFETVRKEEGYNSIQIPGLAPIKAKTPNQSDYVARLQDYTLNFGFGPAGTGKTYLAMLMLIARLKAKEIDGIVITRPPVDAGEAIGFLPGSEAEKLDPYLRPCLDVLEEVFGVEDVKKMIEEKVIQCNHLGFFRGRTFKNKGVLLDEGQNATPENWRMILTRLGEGSFMIVNGDPEQVDIRGMDGVSYIEEVFHQNGRLPLDTAVSYFSDEDCVRHPIVADLLTMFSTHKDWWEEYKEEQKEKRAKEAVEKALIKSGDLPPLDEE
ncbi:PhoH-like phosphate starvation-inducible [Vibrio phage vB_VpaM_sm033]|nr:PhoH-like phosphate starvation-inducible [Vibrio phage vB_VpaM_sm033]